MRSIEKITQTTENRTNHVPGKLSEAEMARENEEALRKDWPLLPGQVQNLIYQSHAPNSNFLNIPYLVRMKEDVEPQRLAAAVNKVLLRHPALHVRICQNESGTYRQKYEPGFYRPVEVRKMTEEEFSRKKFELQAPFAVGEECCYRCGIIETEQGLYLYLVLHHVISDGAAVNLLMKEFFRVYRDENDLGEPDYYFHLLKNLEAARATGAESEAAAWFSARLDGKLQSGIPIGLRIDHESEGRTSHFLVFRDAFEKNKNHSATFFLTAAALAEAWYNGTDFAFVLNIYGDRSGPVRMSTAGYLAAFLTLGLNVSEDTAPVQMLAEVREQNNYAKSHTAFSYVNEKIGDSSLMLRFNYQKNLATWQSETDLAGEVLHLPPSPLMPGVLSLSIFDHPGAEKIGFAVRYAAEVYEKSSMERFAELFFKAVDFLEER